MAGAHEGTREVDMIAQWTRITMMLVAAAIGGPGCGKDSTGPGDEGPDYDPQIPAAWAAGVTNPYFKLVPGTTFEFEGKSDESTETVRVEVLSSTRVVNGVTATVVRDRVYVDDELVEDTDDWFAQDAAGNVWYLGEDSKEIEDGEIVSRDGSWEWGVDEALPGIIMWADPAAHVGEEYRQEFYEGEAEDWGKVVSLGESVEVPFGTLTDCVKIEEWNALESGPHEFKYYAPQIGVVLEVHEGSGERVELIEMTGP
jgi:hypothetical protein